MTYQQFLDDSMSKQAAYIREETHRYAQAQKLRWRYEGAMSRLSLHALDSFEISDRLKQLDDMKKRIRQTHGDTPGNRAIYDSFHGDA